MEEWESLDAVVMDNGASHIKIGIAGNDAPTYLCPTLVGCHNNQTFLGKDQLASNYGMCSLSSPFLHGIVTNWDHLEQLYDHSFKTIKIDPSTRPVLFTEHPLTSTQERAKMIELLFEKFKVPATFAQNKCILSVYASGRCTAICLQIGDGICSSVPVYEGYTVPESIFRVNFGGGDITNYLMRMLNERGHSFSSATESQLVRELKETHGFVAASKEESRQTTDQQVKVNHKTIHLDKELSLCREALFQPSLLGRSGKGVHELLWDAIQRSDNDTRKDFYGNLLVSGGTTLFKGFTNRLETEMCKLGSHTCCRFKVVAPPERLFSSWVGGSILGSLSTFQQMWYSRQEYDELGSSGFYRTVSC